MDRADARGRGVPGRVRGKQALQFRRPLSTRARRGTAPAPSRHAPHRLVADCDRSHGRPMRDRAEGARPRQGAGRRGVSFATCVWRPGAGLCRRRCDRRKRIRRRAAAGGRGYSVGSLRPGATGVFADPRAVRDWLAEFADRRKRRMTGRPADQEAEPRSRADRQQLRRRARRPQRANRLVVLPLFRFRSGVLAPARRRRGEGLLRRRARRTGSRPNRTMCATPRSSRPSSPTRMARRFASPISRRASTDSSASTVRRRSCAASSRSRPAAHRNPRAADP